MEQNHLNNDNRGIPPDVRATTNLPNRENEETEGEKTAIGLAGFLYGLSYPAAKEDILDYAADSELDETVVDMLEQLPDTTYNNPSDVSQALGENSNRG